MNRMTKMRTVRVNNKGQLVIPEEMRTDLGITAETVLVLLERDGELVLRREQDVLHDLEPWTRLSQHALAAAWGEEDEVWDEAA